MYDHHIKRSVSGMRLIATITGVIAISSTPLPLAAQQQSSVALEEIVVTARRQVESLQDVPDAVTAFTAQDIEDAGVDRVDDVLSQSPNIDIRNDQQPGVYTLTVRGVSTVRNGQPPVAYVVDGVTLPSSNSLTQELFDIQQIEILKGPQGALYGRNSIGGAISVTTKQPTDQFEGAVELSGGKGSTYGVKAAISGPIAMDTAYFRLSGLYKDSDGLLDNSTTGADADWEETQALRGKLLLMPAEHVTLDLRASLYDLEAGSTYYVPLGIAMPLGPALPLNAQTGKILGDFPSFAEVESSDFSVKVEWETGLGTLTSITSYNELEEINVQEIDWTASSFLEGRLLTDVEGFTQEVRFSSESDQSVRWFVGAFYQDIERQRGTNAFINASSFGGDLDPANKLMVPIANEKLDQDWKSYALFGQVNYDLLEQLELTLALRYDIFETDETQIIAGVKGPDLDETFNELQPKMSLAYRWNEDFMTYLTVAKGWRPGGFGLPNLLNITSYDEETLINYEVGFKSSFFENRLIVNGAAYYIDYDQQQFFLLTSNAGGGPVQLLVNGDKSTIKGVDIEVTARPVEGLDISAGFGLVDHELRAIGADISTPFPATVPGNKLPNTADSSVNLSVQYAIPIADRFELITRVDYSRLGKTYWTLDNVLSEDPYELVNLRLTLAAENWRVTAVAENIFDEEYYSQVFDSRWSGFVTDTGWPSKPAYYGLEVKFEF